MIYHHSQIRSADLEQVLLLEHMLLQINVYLLYAVLIVTDSYSENMIYWLANLKNCDEIYIVN